MSALLRQLVGSDLRSPLRGSVTSEFQERKATANSPPRLNLEEVVEYILNIIEDNPAVLVIDALNEIDEDGRGELFDSLERVLYEAQNVVKIFLSSRNDWDIIDRFGSSPGIGIKESMNANDIRTFTECRM